MLFSVGVRPELGLACKAGLEIGSSGGLVVDDHLRTSDPDIYAAGDMLEILQRISGRRVRVPLAGPANRQGRIAASNALGLDMTYRGALGTSAVKIFETTAAMTGLSERAECEAGFDVGIAVIHKGHHAGYYPGAEELSLKLIYDKKTARLIGPVLLVEQVWTSESMCSQRRLRATLRSTTWPNLTLRTHHPA